ncbi:MAG: UDP-N-acetylglucosamine 1-carboxyvinyltransferase [Verrucomicrobia bacterium]|nr:UDP-N-acetylglucosamine 1-carboxyvinyltransferase [Verrucomicrobiota bacterium]MCH8512762.1 UDP-N-acetylglucosamine 1-carboxyvinyltransferase [Kiritimatiellia bacterium]
MSRFLIQGGQPLSGELTPTGNKNAALPMLAASLLTDQPVTLRRVPDIADVRVMCELLAELGVEIIRDQDTVRLHARQVNPDALSPEGCKRIRGSILLAGPLLARCGRIHLAPPGGDVIGRRRLDTHLHGLVEMGANLDMGPDHLAIRAASLHPANLLLDEASVTATENLVMAAAAIPGETILYNAACEPHVQDVCRLLQSMGAEINGIGTNRLVIRGSNTLGGADVELGADYIEAASYLTAAAITGGNLRLKRVHNDDVYRVIHRGFARLGCDWAVDGEDWVFAGKAAPKVADDLGGAIPKIEDGIWPAFPSDLMSILLVLATQAEGSVLFFEKLFESRMVWVDRLISMGARIVQCDPHRVLVSGPSPLSGSHQTSPDIRAGMALILAALCAKGESIIENAWMIDRGYENVDARLRGLGARIERQENTPEILP